MAADSAPVEPSPQRTRSGADAPAAAPSDPATARVPAIPARAAGVPPDAAQTAPLPVLPTAPAPPGVAEPDPAHEPVRQPPTGRPRRGRVPALVWAITALHISLLAMCTMIYPTFTGADETVHVDMTYAYANGHGFYDPGTRLLARGLEVVYGSLKVPPKRPYSDTRVTPRGHRLSIDAAGGEAPPQGYLVPNQMVQHPPLYYLMGAAILDAPGVSDLPYDRQVALLRLLSIVLIAPLPLLAWATARRLTDSGVAPLVAAVLPVTIPGLYRLGAMVNNDNLLILLSAALMLVLARVLTGDLRKRTGVLTGTLLGLALLTKGFALALPLVVAAAYTVAWLRYRRQRPAPIAAFGLAAVLGAGLGGWWWVRNQLLFGVLQPDGLGEKYTRIVFGEARPGGAASGFLPKFLDRVTLRYWGGLGYPDPPTLPRAVTHTWFALLLAGALLGVVLGLRGRWGRAAAGVMFLPTLGFAAIVYVGAVDNYLLNMRLVGLQGRYLYGGLTGLTALFALGTSRMLGRLARLAPLVLLVAGLLTQALAWKLLLGQWWVPTAAIGQRYDRMLRGALAGVERWSPWPAPVTDAPFVAVLACSLLVLAIAVRTALRPPQRTLPLSTEAAPEEPATLAATSA